ncbi:MAG: hypothetical protein ABI679_14295, partial [Gemmatimonadota bacterium]
MSATSLLSCGGGGNNGGGPDPSPLAIAKAAPSGDVQTGVVAQALTDSFRVIVTEDGAPKAGVSVTWSVS